MGRRSTPGAKRRVYGLSVAQRHSIVGPPSAFVSAGTWPECEFAAGAPIAVFWAAELSRRLAAALADRTIAGIARDAQLARTTIYDILNGDTWPDVVSIVKLQDALTTSLWPDWPAGWRPPH